MAEHVGVHAGRQDVRLLCVRLQLSEDLRRPGDGVLESPLRGLHGGPRAALTLREIHQSHHAAHDRSRIPLRRGGRPLAGFRIAVHQDRRMRTFTVVAVARAEGGSNAVDVLKPSGQEVPALLVCSLLLRVFAQLGGTVNCESDNTNAVRSSLTSSGYLPPEFRP